jgi:hypothetical protein
MKFRLCGDQDCPDWVLAQISNMADIRNEVMTRFVRSFPFMKVAFETGVFPLGKVCCTGTRLAGRKKMS